MSCNEIDFMYPMIADIYHPIVKQDIYGQVKKDWGFDRTIVISLNPAGSAFEEEVKPIVSSAVHRFECSPELEDTCCEHAFSSESEVDEVIELPFLKIVSRIFLVNSSKCFSCSSSVILFELCVHRNPSFLF